MNGLPCRAIIVDTKITTGAQLELLKKFSSKEMTAFFVCCFLLVRADFYRKDAYEVFQNDTLW